MIKNFRNLKNDKSGASAAEYALIIALVGVAISAGASALADQINTRLSTTATTIQTAS